MRVQAHAVVVGEMSVIEDHRGVDVSQIRRQLRMSVEERVRYMVDVANTLMDIRGTARCVDTPRSRGPSIRHVS